MRYTLYDQNETVVDRSDDCVALINGLLEYYWEDEQFGFVVRDEFDLPVAWILTHSVIGPENGVVALVNPATGVTDYYHVRYVTRNGRTETDIAVA